MFFEPGAQDAERRVLDMLPTASIVRASWFFQNFSENFLLDSVLAGEIALPVGDVCEPFIDADDIAEVAVMALTNADYEGQVIEVTGPQSMTFAQACAEIGAAIGRPVRFRQISRDAFRENIARSGAPQDLADLMQFLFTEVLDGRNVNTASGVQRVLGRPPRSFRDFAEATARTGIWTSQETVQQDTKG